MVEAQQQTVATMPRPGTLAGRVVAASAGVGLPAATVTLRPAAPNVDARTSSNAAFDIVTDDDGQFVFRTVPAGRYFVAVSKPGYLAAEYGAGLHAPFGTAVVVSAATRPTVTLEMIRGAVITGVVTDIDGLPAANVEVDAFRGAHAEKAVTDDRGVYRIYGLAPGDYLVAAVPGGQVSEAATALRTSDVTSTLAALSAMGGRSPLPPASPSYRYAPVFYPGTTQRSDAITVDLNAEEERRGIDLPLILAGTSQLIGHIDGFAAGDSAFHGVSVQSAFVAMAALNKDDDIADEWRRAPVDQAGDFRFRNVLPGRYRIVARVVSTPASGADKTHAPASRWASKSVDVVAGGSVRAELQLRLSFEMVGVARFDGEQALRNGRVRFTLDSLTDDMGPRIHRTARPSADGQFRFDGLVPGRYALRLDSVSVDSLWLRSAMSGAVDLLDSTLVVNDDDQRLRNLVVTVSSQPSGITGTFWTTDQRAAEGYVIIAFPTDRRFWTPGSRRVVATRSGEDGAYSFQHLPPGDYLIVALHDLPAGDWTAPQVLDSVATLGVRVAVRVGQLTHQDIGIARHFSRKP
jgi:protocatechuate 3,4-dioxygenase beta subunit